MFGAKMLMHVQLHAHVWKALTILIGCSRWVQSKVQLLSERAAIISVDEIKHTLMHHVWLLAEEHSISQAAQFKFGL